MLRAKASGVATSRRRNQIKGSLPKGGRRPFEFKTLHELRAKGRWLTPPRDLVLERFSISFPTSDITRLAYDREL